jgi:hypothetical protein
VATDKHIDGVDFHPDMRKPKKQTVSFTVSDEAKLFLEYLQEHYKTNVSAYLDQLILTVKKMSGVMEPTNYSFENGKYREITLLLRKEVADFIEMWKIYGKVGNVCINSTLTQPSTPIQIARKMSFLLAENPEFMGCDSNIYGVQEHVIEGKFQRAGEKSKEVPKGKYEYKQKQLPEEP